MTRISLLTAVLFAGVVSGISTISQILTQRNQAPGGIDRWRLRASQLRNQPMSFSPRSCVSSGTDALGTGRVSLFG